MFVYVYMFIWAFKKKSNTGKKKNLQVWVTNTVIISLIKWVSNVWSINVTLMDSLEDVYEDEINQNC